MIISRKGSSLEVLAPAKLNLALEVLRRRDDGYHELETTMLSVRLYDTLSFCPSDSDELKLTCSAVAGSSSSSLVADERNLVLRAARLLREETGSSAGATIHLQKRIPVEAGMGGGSSDAAATLVALNQFWNLNLESQKLHQLASRLGSDVNFFLESPVAARCTGRGEQIQPLAIRGTYHFVIVKPPFGLSTAQVFQQWKSAGGSRPGSNDAVKSALESGRADQLGQAIHNDLTQPALMLNPGLENLLERFQRESVAGFGMTGSGSACFALCGSAAMAQALATRCRQERLGEAFAVSSGC